MLRSVDESILEIVVVAESGGSHLTGLLLELSDDDIFSTRLDLREKREDES